MCSNFFVFYSCRKPTGLPQVEWGTTKKSKIDCFKKSYNASQAVYLYECVWVVCTSRPRQKKKSQWMINAIDGALWVCDEIRFFLFTVKECCCMLSCEESVCKVHRDVHSGPPPHTLIFLTSNSTYIRNIKYWLIFKTKLLSNMSKERDCTNKTCLKVFRDL